MTEEQKISSQQETTNTGEDLASVPSSLLSQQLMELYERRAIEKVTECVEKELIKRYMWIGIIVALVSGSVITLLVQTVVSSILSNTKTSLAVSDELLSRGKKDLESVEEKIKKYSDLEKKINEMNDFTKKTEESLKRVKENVASLTKVTTSSNVKKEVPVKIGINEALGFGQAFVCNDSILINKELVLISEDHNRIVTVFAVSHFSCVEEEVVLINSEEAFALLGSKPIEKFTPAFAMVQ